MDELSFWIYSQAHRNKMVNSQGGLPVSWSDIYNQPLTFSFQYFVQLSCDKLVMPTHNKSFLFVCAKKMPCKIQHIAKAVAGGVDRFCYTIRFQVYCEVLLVLLSSKVFDG